MWLVNHSENASRLFFEHLVGGFNSVGTRTPFPLGDAFIKLDQHHASAVGRSLSYELSWTRN